MNEILQINLHCCRGAQFLRQQVANEKDADFIFITEPHHIVGTNWPSDSTNKTAIANIKRVPIDALSPKEQRRFC